MSARCCRHRPGRSSWPDQEHDRRTDLRRVPSQSCPARRAGAKSDVIDAERAARDALARTKLAAPKTGPERAGLQALLAARRSAVDAATTAQRQLRALVITAPEQVRSRFRGHTTRAM